MSKNSNGNGGSKGNDSGFGHMSFGVDPTTAPEADLRSGAAVVLGEAYESAVIDQMSVEAAARDGKRDGSGLRGEVLGRPKGRTRAGAGIFLAARRSALARCLAMGPAAPSTVAPSTVASTGADTSAPLPKSGN